MTFVSPALLLLLMAPLALLGGYLLVERRRRAVVVRFTSVDLLASVAPRRPGWQRHLAGAALLGALSLFVLGLARPARVVRTPKQRATVMLSLDTSGSMVAADVTPTRLAVAERAARAFVDALPRGVQLGVVSFANDARVLVAPTTDRSSVVAAIDGLVPNGGTATADAIDLSLEAIAAVPTTASGGPAPGAIVLMSDGAPTVGRGNLSPTAAVAEATAAARAVGVRVSTIAFGTAEGEVHIGGRTIAVPSDPDAMRRIADDTGGHTFTATSSGQLSSVYRQIGRAVGYDVHRRDIAQWFTAIGFALALLAGVAALVWSQRIL